MPRTKPISSKHNYHNARRKVPEKVKTQGRTFQHISKSTFCHLDSKFTFTASTVMLLMMIASASAIECHNELTPRNMNNLKCSTPIRPLTKFQNEMTTAYALEQCIDNGLPPEFKTIPQNLTVESIEEGSCPKRISNLEKRIGEGDRYRTCSISQWNLPTHRPPIFPTYVYPIPILGETRKYDLDFIRWSVIRTMGKGQSHPILIGVSKRHERERILHISRMCDQYFPRPLAIGVPGGDIGNELLRQIWDAYLENLQKLEKLASIESWTDRHIIEYTAFVDTVLEFQDHPFVANILCIRGLPIYMPGQPDFDSVVCPGNLIES